MKYAVLFSLCAAIAFFSGCTSAPRATTIFGTECRAMSEEEITRLINYTRAALKRHEKKYSFTDEEKKIIKKNRPQIFIEYRGDCYGTMFIYWKTPARRIGLRFEDHFNATPPSCAMILGSNNGEVSTGIKPDKTRRGR